MTDIHDDDAEFDDFLLGKGELSDLLQTLPQPTASAGLDDRILRDIEARLVTPAMPAPTPAAANDAASTQEKRPAPGFFARWRTPLGLAATLVLTMSITMTVWRGQNFAETPAVLSENQSHPAPATTAAAEPDTVPAAEPAAKPAAAPSGKDAMAPGQDAVSTAAAPLRPAKAKTAARFEQQEERKIAVPEKADQRSASGVQDAGTQRLREEVADLQKKKAAAIPPPAPVPAPLAAPMPAPPPPPLAAPMPAPMPAPQAQAQPEGRIQVHGQRIQRMSDDKAAADAASAPYSISISASPAKGEAAESASDWLQRIEKLLQEGKHKQALEEWRIFRMAWPHYPVAPATEKQIEALRAQK
jgi:hypothetical protein